MTGAELSLLLGCFLFVLAAVLAGGYWFLREPAAETAPSSPPLIYGADGEERSFRETLERIGSVVPDASLPAAKIRRRLLAAGYRDQDAALAFAGLKALSSIVLGLCCLAGGIFLEMKTASVLLFGMGGAGLGYLIPDRVLTQLAVKRRERLRQALAPAIDLLVLSLEAGQGLDGAMMEASRELRQLYPDLSEELMLTHLEMRAGQSRADVLEHFGQRSGEPELRKLASLLLDGDRFGTALGPALRNHAKYLRTRRRQKAQEEARKTTVKLVFPVFFLIFPSVMVVTLGPAVLRLASGLSTMLNSMK
jgi:tight adherence protein C